MPVWSRFALRTRSCEIHAPYASALCCTLNAPQKPPDVSHWMPGATPPSTRENCVFGGVHVPGATHGPALAAVAMLATRKERMSTG